MTLLSKAVISALVAITSLFILKPPLAPTASDLQTPFTSVYEAYEAPIDIPAPTTSTTLITPAIDLCGQVFDMAKYIGWPDHELSKLIAVAQRESRCTANAFNPNDPNGGSAGVMQINYFWCKPSQYWPYGYLQAHGLLTDCSELFNLETNLRSALAIYRYSDGWRAWSI